MTTEYHDEPEDDSSSFWNKGTGPLVHPSYTRRPAANGPWLRPVSCQQRLRRCPPAAPGSDGGWFLL